MRFGERVLETSTTASTGSYALAGAVAGHVTFLAGIPGGASADADVGYVVVDSAGAGFEVTRGALGSGPATLSRAQIFASSNAGAAVNWSPGTRYIYSAPIATLMQSLLRGNRGTARPAWLPEGGTWIDETNAPILVRYYFDGTTDIRLERIDETNNRAIFECVKGADIASAGSIDIGAATGDFIHITGTTTITALGSANQGTERTLVFDGVLTLTHNATSLILPGSANIATIAGDVAVMRSEGAGNWRCVSYQRRSGKATLPISATDLPTATTAAQGALPIATAPETLALTEAGKAVVPLGLALLGTPDLLDTLTTTSGSTATSITLPKCRAFMILMEEVSGSGTAALQCTVSDDDGANWSSNIMTTNTQSSSYGRHGTIWLLSTGVTGNKVTQVFLGTDAGGDLSIKTSLVTSITGVINKIRFAMSAGSFDGGKIYIFGIR